MGCDYFFAVDVGESLFQRSIKENKRPMVNDNGNSSGSGKSSGISLGQLFLYGLLAFILMMVFAPDVMETEIHVLSDWVAELRILSPSAVANPVINVVVEPPNFDGLAKAIGEQAAEARRQTDLMGEDNEIQRGIRIAQEQAAGALSRAERCAAQIRDTPSLFSAAQRFFGDDPCD